MFPEFFPFQLLPNKNEIDQKCPKKWESQAVSNWIKNSSNKTSELKCHCNIWWNSFHDAPDSRPIKGSCSTDFIGFESGTIKGT